MASCYIIPTIREREMSPDRSFYFTTYFSLGYGRTGRVEYDLHWVYGSGTGLDTRGRQATVTSRNTALLAKILIILSRVF